MSGKSNERLKIAIDARCLSERFTSNRTYWFELLRELAQVEGGPELVLFSQVPIEEPELLASPGVTSVVLPSLNGRVWSLLTFPRAAKRQGCNLAHMQYTVSPLFRIPTLTTVHDVSFFVNPAWFSRRDGFLLRRSVPAACRKAAAVIVPSESSKRELGQYAGTPAEKVFVTPLGAPTVERVGRQAAREAVKASFGFDKPFFVSVGLLQPRKNWQLAISSVAATRLATKQDVQLVITGPKRDDEALIDRVIRECRGESWVHLVGGVPPEGLWSLLEASLGLLHPSLHEGFGLTPLEAFALGTPVICSDRGSLPEVVEGVATMLDPTDPAAWWQAESKLVENGPAAGYEDRALERAAQFTWKRTAAETLAAYRFAVGRKADDR